VSEEGVKRRLAAIFAADVVGFSRLMGEDEAGTLARLKTLRKDLVQPEITGGRGRIVKLMGDGLLAEFSSAVEAVRCAIGIQQGMVGWEADLPEKRRIRLRIGVNLGDIIVEGSDIYGDGVNVAARLEALADPGGICISGPAFDMVEGKLDLTFEDIGEQQLKNISKPVRIYRLASGSLQAGPPTHQAEPLPLPDKPSIAVLPFDNMSADADQEFFADGITEDIITALSKFRSLFVIARNSAFSFKGQSIEVKDIGRKLGVRYVVEGSVRRAGNRVRITAQLIDAVADTHLWAERYDRDLEDIFAVQDEVTDAIVTAIEPQLASVERQRARRKPTESLDAWDCYQRGLWHLYRYSAEDYVKAVDLFERAIALDPTFASARAGLAFTLYYGIVLGFTQDYDDNVFRGFDAARAAVMLDDDDPYAHVALGRMHTIRTEHDEAIAACDRAISLNPSYAQAHFGRAHSLWMSGRPADAIISHDEAMRLSPRDPMMWAFMASKAIALILLQRYDDALAWTRKGQRQADLPVWAHMPEVCALGLLGRIDEARAALDHVRQLKPDVSLDFVDQALKFTNASDREHFVDGLRIAGLEA
jgi:adenylate cyclase